MCTYVPWCTVEVRGLRTTFRSQFLPFSAGCRLSCLYSKCFCLLSHLAGLRLNKIFLCALCVVCVHSVCSGAFSCTCAHVCRLEVHVNSFPHSLRLMHWGKVSQTELRAHQNNSRNPYLLPSAGITGGAAELHPMLTSSFNVFANFKSTINSWDRASASSTFSSSQVPSHGSLVVTFLAVFEILFWLIRCSLISSSNIYSRFTVIEFVFDFFLKISSFIFQRSQQAIILESALVSGFPAGF